MLRIFEILKKKDNFFDNKKKETIIISNRGKRQSSKNALILANIFNYKDNNLFKLIFDSSDVKQLKEKNFFFKNGVNKFIDFNVKKFFLFYKKELFLSIYPTFYYSIGIYKKGFYWFINNCKIKNTYIGDLVFDTYCNKNYNFTNPKVDLEFLKILFLAVFKTICISKMIHKESIKTVIINTNSYCFVDGLLCRVGISNKLRVYEFLNFNFIKRYNLFNTNYGYFSLKKKKKKVKRVLISNKKLKNFINQRFNMGIKTNYTFSRDLRITNNLRSAKYYDRNDILRKFSTNEKNSKKFIVVLSAHAFSDAPHCLGKKFLFNDYFDQFKQTLDVIKNYKNNICWLIRANPTTYNIGEKKIIKDMVININSKNIRLAPSNITSKNLVEICDAVVTGRGTMALEFACFGKPALIAGPATYSGFGIVKESKNRNAYFKNLLNIKNQKKLSISKVILARKILYYLETQVPHHFNGNPDLKKGFKELNKISQLFTNLSLKPSMYNKNVLNKFFAKKKSSILTQAKKII